MHEVLRKIIFDKSSLENAQIRINGKNTELKKISAMVLVNCLFQNYPDGPFECPSADFKNYKNLYSPHF